MSAVLSEKQRQGLACIVCGRDAETCGDMLPVTIDGATVFCCAEVCWPAIQADAEAVGS